MRILASCSTVDIKRVIEVVKSGREVLPPELMKPKGKLALSFAILATDAGMTLEDLADVRQVKLWDNHKLETDLFPRVSLEKRGKWKSIFARPLDLNKTIERFRNV